MARVEADPVHLVKFAKLHVHLVLDDPVQILSREVFEDEVDVVAVDECVLEVDDVIEGSRW